MFFALPNLCTRAVTPCPTPWTFQAPIPDAVKGKENKKARDKWINQPSTQHQVYTAFEGFIPNERIRDAKASDEGNPPLRMHAFVADFDAPVSLEEISAGIERLKGFTPNYLERTLSGNARLIWIFEKPVSFPNLRFCKEFLSLALKRGRFDQVVVGLDVPAWENPNRLWSNSCDWLQIDPDARIPHGLLNGWIVEVAEKHVWRRDRGAIDIPLPVVQEKLLDLYPAFKDKWTGEFVEGAQGPSFWVEGSESPKSAIVKPTGLFTFAAHAVKPFYSWTDLLGKDFVDKYAAEAMGKAVEGIYHDGKVYFRRDGYGNWKAFSKEDTQSHLHIDRGLSSTKDGSSPSEVARAIQYIQNWQGINGAAPFVFSPPGIIMKNGFKFLNTHTRQVLQPAAGPSLWGQEGKFPWVSAFFDQFFSSPIQLTYFLAWLSRFYKGAYHLDLESGQAVIILGVPGKGKTMLSQGLIPKLMGGHADAEQFLMGESDFNSQLFESALWTIDDNSVTTDAARIRRFSALFKKMAANTSFTYHEKFRVPCAVDWLGRVLVTANDDEESVRIVPDLSISILDKLMLFRARTNSTTVFPVRSQMIQILDRELPHFARFLLEHQIPDELIGEARYGIKAYHDPLILQTADQSSRTAVFVEMLEDWRDRFFAENAGATYWQGTSWQFLRELTKNGSERSVGIGADQMGMRLASVKAKGGFKIEVVSDSSSSSRVWRIPRPEPKTEETLPVGTKFQK